MKENVNFLEERFKSQSIKKLAQSDAEKHCIPIIFIGAAKYDAVLMWTNWVTVIQVVHICWLNGNDIGADNYVSQLGN